MRMASAVLGALVLAVSAEAEIAVMAGGKILYIDRFERTDETITMFLTGGGEVTVPSDWVTNIVPNEIIVHRGADPEAVRLLPHLQPVIEPVAAKYGLDPNLVAAVIWAESSGDPNAVSTKGAQGLMQLMPATARELGIGNVFDPHENVDGGAHYLRRMIDEQGGDLSLALAAYNAGPDAVRQHAGVPPYRETRDYVGKVMSAYERARGADE